VKEALQVDRDHTAVTELANSTARAIEKARELRHQAEVLLRAGDYEKAESVLHDGLLVDQEDTWFAERLGELPDQVEQALSEAQRLLSEGRFRDAEAAAIHGNASAPNAEFQRLAELAGQQAERAEALIARASDTEAKGPAGAAAILGQVLELQPFREDLRQKATRLGKRVEQAQKRLDHARERERKKQWAEVREAAEQALEANPSLTEAATLADEASFMLKAARLRRLLLIACLLVILVTMALIAIQHAVELIGYARGTIIRRETTQRPQYEPASTVPTTQPPQVGPKAPLSRLRVDQPSRVPLARIPHGRGAHLVDTDARVLKIPPSAPPDIYSQLPKITGLTSSPPTPGQQWNDLGLRAGLGVLQALQTGGVTDRLQVVNVDLSNFGGRKDPRSSEIVLELPNDVRILWGRSVGTFGEVPLAQKLEKIRTFLKHGADIGGVDWNVRFENGGIIPR